MITFVYAQDEHGAIGFKQDLPWYLPNDLKHFKETTMGHTMVMGRKTFESMGKRLLPGRKSVVVTNQADYGADIPELMVLHNIEDVLELGKNQELMVIGGAGLYESLWPHVDKIARTVIYDTFEADTFIPEIDKSKFELVKVVHGVVDEKNVHARDYEWWKRKEGATCESGLVSRTGGSNPPTSDRLMEQRENKVGLTKLEVITYLNDILPPDIQMNASMHYLATDVHEFEIKLDGVVKR